MKKRTKHEQKIIADRIRKRTSRQRKKNTKRANPGYSPPPIDVLTDFGGNALIYVALTGCTFREKTLIAALIPTMLQVIRGVIPNDKVFDALLQKHAGKDKPTDVQCSKCGGDCLCHSIGALGGTPCPRDCPNYGNHLDGCHRCDCEVVQ